MSHSLTYSDYLRVDELLDLQSPRSQGPAGPEHDEMLFIIIHQVYELWFKQLLHEADFLCERLRADDLPRSLHTFRRMLTILKTCVSQIDILETMTPLEFNSFRGYLDTASGFQSYQFRAMEFALGYKRRGVFQYYPAGTAARALLEERYEQPTLWDAFLHYLAAKGHPIPAAQLLRDVTEPVMPSPTLQALLIDVYRRDPDASRVCEHMVDWDEGVQEWRYRHVKMVERTIGNKRGTGGSSGVEYLRSTLKPLFPDLWAIRSEL